MRNWKNEWLKKHAHYFTDIAMLFVFVGGIPLYIVIRNFVVNHYQFTLPGPNITNVIIFIIAVFTVSKIFSHLKYQKKKADQQKQLYAEFLARKKDLQIKQFYRLLHIIMEPQSDPAQIKKAQKVLIP